jgi:cell division protein FtsL
MSEDLENIISSLKAEVESLRSQLAKAEAEKNGNSEIFKAFLDGLSNIIDNDSYEKILEIINKHGNNK